ncbi:MAG TPA: hypothetical protein VMT47_11760 [Polyangia bacterium]|nr:hypothetical protein [Polyangia bacterium]
MATMVTVTPNIAAFTEEQADALLADIERMLAIKGTKENLRVGGVPTCHWSVLVPKSAVLRIALFVEGWRAAKGLI